MKYVTLNPDGTVTIGATVYQNLAAADGRWRTVRRITRNPLRKAFASVILLEIKALWVAR